MKLYKITTHDDTTHYVLAKTRLEAKHKYVTWAQNEIGRWCPSIRNCIELYLITQ